eukprot:625252-Hanusia_phi.AAC.2
MERVDERSREASYVVIGDQFVGETSTVSFDRKEPVEILPGRGASAQLHFRYTLDGKREEEEGEEKERANVVVDEDDEEGGGKVSLSVQELILHVESWSVISCSAATSVSEELGGDDGRERRRRKCEELLG